VKRILLLLILVAMLTAMVLGTAGTPLAVPGNNGKGAGKANFNAGPGISNAINKSGSCQLICG
jgi:hypothetical protein